MSIFTHFSLVVTILLCLSTQQFDVVFAMGKLPKKRAKMSSAQRKYLSDLAKARAASRRAFAEEKKRDEQAEADLAQAIQSSLEEEQESIRRVRPREGDVVDDDEGENEEMEQVHGLEQGHDNLCGIYALYFARVFNGEGAVRDFDESDRAAFDNFLTTEVLPIKFQYPRGTGTVLQVHRRGTFYGQDELAFVAKQLNIRCFIGDLRAGFFDETLRVYPAAALHGFAQEIKAGRAPETCVIFNTGGGHWVSIFITKTKLYLADSRNCEVRCETESIKEFVARIWLP